MVLQVKSNLLLNPGNSLNSPEISEIWLSGNPLGQI